MRGFVSEARLRRAGGATRSELMSFGPIGLIIYLVAIFWAWKAGERNELRFLETDERKKGGRAGGGTEEKSEHVPPGPFAQRLRSTPTLVPRFGLDPATSSDKHSATLKYRGCATGSNDFLCQEPKEGLPIDATRHMRKVRDTFPPFQ
jgi:hypothetical protein